MSVNVLGEYLHEMGTYPLLTAKEEIALAKEYRENGDEAAREQLINCNLRLVINIAKKYYNSHLDLLDLIQEGNLGLITAVDKYNPDLGYRFSTCATPWIKQAITKSIIDKGKNIRIPAHVYQLLNKYRQACEQLSKDGHKPTIAELAAALNVDEEKIQDIEFWKQDTVSLSSPLGDDGEDTLEDLQADYHNETPAQYTARKLKEEKIQELIAGLKPRTQIIMKLRFGLGNDNDPEEFRRVHTLEEIGDYIGITRERVRQVEKETLAKLRMEWNGEY